MDAENLEPPTEDQWIEKYRAAIAVMPVESSRSDRMRAAFVQFRSAVADHFENISGKIVDRILDQWTRARGAEDAKPSHAMPGRSLPAAVHMMPSSIGEELAQRKTG